MCALLDPDKNPRVGLLEAKVLADPAATWVERAGIDKVLKEQIDASGWPPDGRSVARSVTVKAGADTTVGAVKAGAEGWPWIEAHARAGKGRWALCGLGVIAKWDAGPTPRFLFVRMLEHLTDTGAERSKKESER